MSAFQSRLSACLVVLLLNECGGVVIPRKFAEVQPYQEAEAILIYKAGERKSDELLAAVEQVAPRHPDITWIKVNAAIPENSGAIAQSGIASKFPTFLVTKEGSDWYDGAETVQAVEGFIQFKKAPVDLSNVFSFASEEVLTGVAKAIPVLVRFVEQWCQHSRGMTKYWAQLARMEKQRVQFVDADCGQPTTRLFCNKHGISQTPSVILFRATDTIKYWGPKNQIEDMRAFLNKWVALPLGSPAHSEL